jgi:hypothetical protein
MAVSEKGLLPLREKVAPKGSDEGSRRLIRLARFIMRRPSRNPSSVGYADTFSRKGRRSFAR